MKRNSFSRAVQGGELESKWARGEADASRPGGRGRSEAPLHATSVDAALRAKLSPARGLSRDEAVARRALFGPNALPEAGPPSPLLLLPRRFRDALLTMPPQPLTCQGHEAIAAFLHNRAALRGADLRIVRTRANGQPAIACYLPDPDAAIARPYGMIVSTPVSDAIAAITWFGDPGVLRPFGLPPTLPSQRASVGPARSSPPARLSGSLRLRVDALASGSVSPLRRASASSIEQPKEGQMLYALFGWVHAALTRRARAITLALEGQRGQGTVEYVGLILLVSLLMVGMVAAMRGFNGKQGTELAEVIVEKIKSAVNAITFK